MYKAHSANGESWIVGTRTFVYRGLRQCAGGFVTDW